MMDFEPTACGLGPKQSAGSRGPLFRIDDGDEQGRDARV
jgi:hypothetical protein